MRVDQHSLSRSALTATARVARRAFFDDPFFTFLLPPDRVRTKGLTIFFRSVLAHTGPKGRVVTERSEEDVIIGIAAGLTTGGYPLSIGTQLTQLPSSIRAFAHQPWQLAVGNAYVQTVAKAHPKEPLWYLLLCNEPPVQHFGVGTSLLEKGFAHIDARGVASYLETKKEENIPYYRRFGYELRETLRPVPSGAPIYTMWRSPR